jgi:hypothetical protein
MKIRWGSSQLALALVVGGILGVTIGAVLMRPRLGGTSESASEQPIGSASSQPSIRPTVGEPSLLPTMPSSEPSDVVLGAWSTAAPMPDVATPRLADAVVVGQDTIMVFLEGDTALPILEYDIPSNTWSKLQPAVPIPGIGTSEVFRQAHDGFIYKLTFPDVYRFDPSLNRWDVVVTDDEVRYTYWARDGVVLDDGSILLVIKQSGSTICLRSFDPISRTVVPLRCEDGRFWNAVLTADGTILVFGEDGVARFDPVANTWTPLSPPPADLFDAGMGLGPDGRVYAFIFGRAPIAFDPISGRWLSVPAPSTDRGSPEVVSGPDGRLYLIGGTTLNLAPELGGHLELMVEVFDPAD